MKQFFRTTIDPLSLDVILLMVRIAIATLMLTHGIPKLGILFGKEPIHFADPIGIGAGPSLAMAAFFEVVGSFMILIGLGTRLAVIPLMVVMAVAAFIVHANDFSKQEVPMLYFIVFSFLFVTGSGRYSLDSVVTK